MVKPVLEGFGKAPSGSEFLSRARAAQDALTHLQAGRWSAAEGKAHEALALNARDPLALKVLGCVALNSGRGVEAISFLEQARVLQPKDPLLHFYLGEAHRLTQSFPGALRHYKKAFKLNPDFAEAFAQTGDVLRSLGQWTEAAEAYRKALKKRPGLPNCLSGLGLLAVRRGDFRAAADYFEAALRLVPFEDVEARASLWANLGSSRLDGGSPEMGVEALSQAVACAPEDPHYAQLLAQNLLHIARVPAGGIFTEVLLRLFQRNDINRSMLATAAILALKINPTTSDLLQDIESCPSSVNGLVDAYDIRIAALLREPLFLAVLVTTPIPDVSIELLLTAVRRRLLLEIQPTAGKPAAYSLDLSFVCALARQCFLNEYIYLAREDEQAALKQLQDPSREVFDGGQDEWDRLAVMACFVPLHEVDTSKLKATPAPEPMEAVLKQQIDEPRQERALMENIQVLKPVQDKVSLAVQAQYEQNPYPRWTSCQISTPRALPDAVRARLPHLKEDRLPDTDSPKILIAGCGTGLQVMNALSSYDDASILGIDLSRTSLGYALRKLGEYGVGTVRLLQADILDLADLEERFDLIESFGVLHHMRDPLRGLKILTTLLKPRGLLFLGLYSESARRSVVQARRLIAERGYSATPDGIRQARYAIMTGEAPPELTVIANPASDFWTMSECRDLIFHVQEHQFTLLQIESMLQSCGLEFLGLEVGRHDQQRFAAAYGKRDALTSLRAWHELELRFPDTFGNTYRLWAIKIEADGGRSNV